MKSHEALAGAENFRQAYEQIIEKKTREIYDNMHDGKKLPFDNLPEIEKDKFRKKAIAATKSEGNNSIEKKYGFKSS